MTAADTLAVDDSPPGRRVESRVDILEVTIRTLATRADIAEVRADLFKMHSDYGKWTVATVITLTFAFLASTTAIISVVRTQPQATTGMANNQPPVVIYNVPPTSIPDGMLSPKKP